MHLPLAFQLRSLIERQIAEI